MPVTIAVMCVVMMNGQMDCKQHVPDEVACQELAESTIISWNESVIKGKKSIDELAAHYFCMQ